MNVHLPLSVLSCSCPCHTTVLEMDEAVLTHTSRPFYTDAAAAMEACELCFATHDLALHAHGFTTQYRPADWWHQQERL